jgi:hypothetical protein
MAARLPVMRFLVLVAALLVVAWVVWLMFPRPVPAGCVPYEDHPTPYPMPSGMFSLEYDTFTEINGVDYYCSDR